MILTHSVLGSSLYRTASEKIMIGAGPEKAVASTKAFTGKIAHLVLLAYAMVNKLPEGKELLNQAAESAQQVLSEKSVNTIRSLARKLKNTKDLYVLGRGISYPLSLETALKIKEISYIHAEGLATGELKHGTLALVEPGTPCLVYLPDDETYGDNLAGAMEVKARGGFVIGVSFKNHDVFDYYIEVADAKEATIIPNAVVAQLLAYYLTLERGFDPDMPRNLAKSVTVK